MSEEIPFKSMKITLSDEAISRLAWIVKKASFRSNSSGVEECIRVVYDLIQEVASTIGFEKGSHFVSKEKQSEAFTRMAMRMVRFTGAQLAPPPRTKENENSAGT